VVLGKVENIWVDNRRGYCQVKWSNSPKAQEYKREVEDGILDNVSFYYTICGNRSLLGKVSGARCQASGEEGETENSKPETRNPKPIY
jgi:hypothetical protein